MKQNVVKRHMAFSKIGTVQLVWLSMKKFFKHTVCTYIHSNSERLDTEKALHEGHADYRNNRSCMDNVYTFIQSRLREDKPTYVFFLDVQKAYDTVWRDGLWLNMGKMWYVIKSMYEASRIAALLDGEKSSVFSLEQGMAQG